MCTIADEMEGFEDEVESAEDDVESPAKTISIEATAKELGIGRRLAYEAAARGEIPTIRIGRRLLAGC